MRRAVFRLAVTVCAVLWAMPARPGEVIYKYDAPNGVTHLSNRRLNKDYRPFFYMRVPQSVDPDKLMAVIRYYGRRHKVDPELVRAMVEVESGFVIEAVSPKGAQGLMQIMPGTGRDLGLAEPFEAGPNIEAGVRYMRAMLDRYGDKSLALAAYNAGPGRVSKDMGIPEIAETRDYVAKVMRRYGARTGMR
ncbi:lytic transglycosylase domain-containing protein [Desulfolutivibrio sulfoxidireducens]|uniref:lytic transglycosylase domain-containing protein n=1 Tax=Desulfolutivibrio sulfoxidireducens TaxID=2773299 RepID=UPI00159EB2FC|nr:lytic transglycosylase domain-containing protein [Desulfolutivibrio sulfoxidireducens]QLA15771.1 transglycosylase SLT domain-containing protein [Desulfolutivibrio sulfoxidireducens]QLA19376.1 transglycosylase SLT domain-containing protein [Desulfolutivibrio sulfoxidireducens]